MKIFDAEKLEGLPKASSIYLIDFERAEVVSGVVNETFILIVSGEKPYFNMEVRLSPLIYVRQPEYWEIEVVGVLPGFGLPATAPYNVSLPLEGIIGTKGIEVVGANKRERFDIALQPGELCNEQGNVQYRASQIPGAVLITAEGTHPTSGYKVFFEQLPIRIFPPQFSLKHTAPDGPVLQVITPFSETTSFQAREKIEEVFVHDAQGEHCVPVEQVPD